MKLVIIFLVIIYTVDIRGVATNDIIIRGDVMVSIVGNEAIQRKKSTSFNIPTWATYIDIGYTLYAGYKLNLIKVYVGEFYTGEKTLYVQVYKQFLEFRQYQLVYNKRIVLQDNINLQSFSDFDYHIPLDGTYHFGWTTKNLGISHDYVESGKVLIRQMSDETETPSIGDVNDFLNYSYPALWSISVELTSQLPKIIGPTGPMGPPGPSNSGPIGVPCLLNVLNCEQKCMESDDNMWCECNNGFLLNNDGITCQDENECLSEGQGRCSHICVNTSGSYHCICRAGYSLTKDGRTCEDLDECQDPIIVENCPFCLNTVGSYTCARLRFSDTNP